MYCHPFNNSSLTKDGDLQQRNRFMLHTEVTAEKKKYSQKREQLQLVLQDRKDPKLKLTDICRTDLDQNSGQGWTGVVSGQC